MNFRYSFVIPVYNRPEEVEDLLRSLTQLEEGEPFEVVLVEDGSENTSEAVVASYKQVLDIQYFLTENQGAGKSRNLGMQKACGNYFLILDSDCLVPSGYLTAVHSQLTTLPTDAFGGPDAAHRDFSVVQKAINFAMTSFLTTGGVRGKKNAVGKFQPRSFNMGISKRAFEETGGFSDQKIGEDIDLTFRLWAKGFQTQFIEKAFVYHKRRSTYKQFLLQTYAFGSTRPFLNQKYPGTAKLTYWFPSLFCLGFLGAVFLAFKGFEFFVYIYVSYFVLLFVQGSLQYKSLRVGLQCVLATTVQFAGYGFGFLKKVFWTLKS